jgi:hypothetical protein
MQTFDMGDLISIKNRSEVLNRLTALGNLDIRMDILRAWENIRVNAEN